MVNAREIFREMGGARKKKALDFLRQNPTSRRIFNNDFTDDFYDDLRSRRDGQLDQHVILNSFGETGSFKSGAMIELGRFMMPDFNADYITFTDQGFLDRVKNSKKGDFILRDEITQEHGIGSGRRSSFIVMQTETLRAHRTSMGFISPTLKQIETSHYVLHCIGPNNFELDDEGEAVTPVYVLLGVMNPQTSNYLGGLIVDIEWNNDVWKEYWDKKVNFLEDVRERHFSKANFKEMANKIFEDPDSNYAKTKYEWFVVIQKVFPDLTTQEMKMLYSQIKMLKRKGNAS